MRSITRSCFLPLIMVFSAALSGCSTAPKAKDQAGFLDKAKSTTEWFQASVPGLSKQIDQSAGFVIFPDVAKWGILYGGGTFGRGALCAADGTQIGWAALNTGSIGLQAGIEGFRMLMVIQDKATLTKFKANQLSGSVSATIVAVDKGASGSAPFQNGLAVYEGANKGLMAGMNIGLDFVRYQPMNSTETPGDLR